MKARSSKYLQSVQSLGNLRPAQLIQFARKTQVYTQNYYFDLSNKRTVHLIIFEKNISTTYLITIVCKIVHKIASVWCKIALGEVGVSLP